MPSDNSHAASGSVSRPEGPSPFFETPISIITNEKIIKGPPMRPNSARRGGTSADRDTRSCACRLRDAQATDDTGAIAERRGWLPPAARGGEDAGDREGRMGAHQATVW